MSTKEISEMSAIALECLREAVKKEFRKKALLGQYVIINRNGKACRVPAKEALQIAEGAAQIDYSHDNHGKPIVK